MTSSSLFSVPSAIMQVLTNQIWPNTKHFKEKLEKFQCQECSYETNYKANLIKHSNGKHHVKNLKKRIECLECNFKTNYQSCLNRHVKAKHRGGGNAEEFATQFWIKVHFEFDETLERNTRDTLKDSELKKTALVIRKIGDNEQRSPAILRVKDSGYNRSNLLFSTFQSCSVWNLS